MIKNIFCIFKQIWLLLKYKCYFCIVGWILDVPFERTLMYKLDKFSFTNMKNLIVGLLKCRTADECKATIKYLNDQYNKQDQYNWVYWLEDTFPFNAKPMLIEHVRMMLTDWAVELLVNNAEDKSLANYYFNNADRFVLNVQTRHSIELFLHTYCDYNGRTFSPNFNNFDDVVVDKSLKLNDIIFVKSTQMYYMNKTGKNESALDWSVI